MRKSIRWSATTTAIFLASTLTGMSAKASVVPVDSAFFTGDPVTTFTGIATGTEVNGLTTNGIHFNYLIGGIPTNGDVIIDGGPGLTNHISPPNIVSIGDNTGMLQLTLPTFTNALGYGFADLSTATLPAATTITLFNGSTNVGSLAYAGSPDPTFTGGFAGINSTVSFNIVDITFDSVHAPAFAADNVVYASASAIPEPQAFVLVATGTVGLLALLARRRMIGAL
jgi:hypothetical protein